MDNVNCLGTESRLTSCQRNLYGSHNCVHSEDVAIDCRVTGNFSGCLYMCFSHVIALLTASILRMSMAFCCNSSSSCIRSVNVLSLPHTCMCRAESICQTLMCWGTRNKVTMPSMLWIGILFYHIVTSLIVDVQPRILNNEDSEKTQSVTKILSTAVGWCYIILESCW